MIRRKLSPCIARSGVTATTKVSRCHGTAMARIGLCASHLRAWRRGLEVVMHASGLVVPPPAGVALRKPIASKKAARVWPSVAESVEDASCLFFAHRVEGLNSSEAHWASKAERVKIEHGLVEEAFAAHFVDVALLARAPLPELPVAIRLVRIAPRALEYDNLVGGFKGIRDAVADQLIPGLRPGIADGDPRLSWEYRQEQSAPGRYFVRIEFRALKGALDLGSSPTSIPGSSVPLERPDPSSDGLTLGGAPGAQLLRRDEDE